ERRAHDHGVRDAASRRGRRAPGEGSGARPRAQRRRTGGGVLRGRARAGLGRSGDARRRPGRSGVMAGEEVVRSLPWQAPETPRVRPTAVWREWVVLAAYTAAIYAFLPYGPRF